MPQTLSRKIQGTGNLRNREIMATDNSERIEKFLRDQMTSEENESFLRDLEQDEELRKEAQLTALMIQDLQERQEKRDSEIINEVIASKKKAKIVQMVRWTASIAAIFLIIFGVYTYHSSFISEDTSTYIALADNYYNQTPKSLFRSGNNELEQELDSLFVEVGTSKEMTPIIDRLQTIHNNIDSEYVYKVSGNDTRIKWFLALAYLKDNQTGKTIELLKSIIKDDKGTYLKENAEQLLRDLEKQSANDD